jgi:rod shape-determining protein MreD
MATSNQPQGGGVILLTIIVAMVVMLIPMSEGLRAVRPEWLLLTLMYWALALPYRMGVGYAWFVGLLMDVLTGGPLGVLAFSYALVIYLVLHFHLQLRQFPVWQQALSLMSLVLLVQLISVLMTSKQAGLHIWLPAITSTLLWPIFYIFLLGILRSFHVR